MNLEEVRRVMNTSFVEQDGLEGTPIYAAWIACELTKLAIALGEDLSAPHWTERIALTAEVLMGVDPMYLEWAITRARHDCTLFPKPVEIFEFLREIPGVNTEVTNEQ